MDTISASKFKATCLAAMERVRRTGRPLRITKFGRPLADVVPVQPDRSRGTWLGAMKDRGRVTGDLVEPVAAPDAWDVLR